MRTRASQDGPKTIKQAKAAFKARGPTSVSAAERRRLERGAQLLERASRLKEQEQRRKELLKKREEQCPTKQIPSKPISLGTQRQLDRFGYKSSQFHLGAFLKAARPPIATERDPASASEPWDTDDDVDDDALLNIANNSPQDRKNYLNQSDKDKGCAIAPQHFTVRSKGITPPVTDEEFGDWDGFLESSTQLTRELSDDKPATLSPPTVSPIAPPDLQFSSFTSIAFDMSVEELEELEGIAVNKIFSKVEVAPSSPKSSSRVVSARERMPPQSSALPWTRWPRAERRGHNDLERDWPDPACLVDLESLAEDIELSQCPAG